MYIGNNYMVQIRNHLNKIQNPEYFIDEVSARNWANSQWKAGAREVVLYKRGRVGYQEVKKVTQGENESKARWIIHIEKLAEEAGATISY
jgi:hypothetical protein